MELNKPLFGAPLSASQLTEKSASLAIMKLNQPQTSIQSVIAWEDLLALPKSEVGPNIISLCQTADQISPAAQTGLKNIIVLEKIKKTLDPAILESFDNVFASKNFSWTLSDLLPFFKYQNSFLTENKPHPTAVIDPSAQLGKNVTIGAYTVIGKNVRLADNVSIGPQCVIEDFVQVGEGTTLVTQVWLGAHTQVGKNCLLHPFISLGVDGFGFFTQPSGEHKKVPQIGYVVVEDFVEMKSFVAVDRGTLGATRIKKGTKFDNHCHIAHNCEIGENSLLAGGFFAAGSTKVGKQFMCGGNTVLTDHIRITDNVMLAGRSTATKDIEKSGAYGGYPLQPLRESLKNLANIAELTTMRKQLSLVMKHLGLGSADENLK